MKKNILFVLLAGGFVFAAQMGTLNRSSDVVTATEMAAYAVDPTSMQAQIDANAAVLSGGITTNLSNLVIVDGVVTGTY